MIGQQRNRLANLGIDIWIPREMLCQDNTAPSLWRDQTIAENIQPVPIQFHVEPTLESTQSTTMIQPVHGVESIVEQQSDTQPAVKPIIAEKEHIPITEQVQAFELQMHILEHCVILLESHQLSQTQQQLWQNIQKAKSGRYAELKWPFPLAEFQESRGLSSYIQGFLDVTTANKKIFCLGQLSFIHHNNILHLASLEDMIAQPLLKRRLWQLMQ